MEIRNKNDRRRINQSAEQVSHRASESKIDRCGEGNAEGSC